jgi:predicted TIM-barrel fold metal-dependent hydrolase
MKSRFFYGGILFFIFSCSTQTRQKAEVKTPEDILLKDFRPVSIYHVAVTKINKAKYPVIDMHTHPYPKNSKQLDEWVSIMDSAGIEKSIVLTYSYGPAFDSLLRVFSKYPERFELWCGIDYTGYNNPGFPERAVKELERCYNAGARGVGEEGDKGKGLFYSKPPAWGMHPDDSRLDPVWEKCADLEMPVNIHVADPKWMYEKMDSTNDGLMNSYTWKVDLDSGVVDHSGMIRILENTVKKHPRTTFIACHLANCCYNLGIIGNLLNTYPNLNIDIAARYSELAGIPRAAKEFLTRYQDRVLYGTDMGISLDMYRVTFRILETEDEHFYNHEHFSYHWPLYAFGLPDAVLAKLYQSNALRITSHKKSR